jgi:ATP-dependent helicase/nuclease subunit A
LIQDMDSSDPLISPEGLQRLLRLTDDQLGAVVEAGHDVVVTAGAGTGKTQTLVARYLWHLANGLTPRQVVAITFTEKAAREMRNRIRAQVSSLAQSGDDTARPGWETLEAQMDAARIGTIHSLCAEILREHPAESDVDPGFEAVDEGWSAALKAQAVEDALAWSVAQPDVTQLFIAFSPYALRSILSTLLERRLDAEGALQSESDAGWMAEAAVDAALKSFVTDPAVERAVAELIQLSQGGDHMTESMAALVGAFLAGWRAAQGALSEGHSVDAAGALYDVRREAMKGTVGRKGGLGKEAIADIRSRYDEVLDPWLGGSSSKDPRPDEAIEARTSEDSPRLGRLFAQAEAAYHDQLEIRRGLDFDDLEAGAARLLSDEAIRRRWQQAVGAVLVDEFQDTNDRQREIIEHLAGEGQGKLFVVGDARQSIYRFRGADVTVFRTLRHQAARSGGKTFDLSMTFRSHVGLLSGLDEILTQVMGTDEGDELYDVPYTSLDPARTIPDRPGEPFVELALGVGERAEDARPLAAQALCARLMALKSEGEISRWDQVALLFRASIGFADYERAFESAGLPFVTVAGRGFYDRPEVRDLLNTLSVLADPTDDLALAGLLRSPAVGMSDAGVFELRRFGAEFRGLLEAIEAPDTLTSPSDRQAAERARILLDDLLPWVDRLPVVELIKRTVDQLDLRAVLAASHSRLWRNVDKLVDDAQASQVIRLTEFLAYLRTLRAAGAREGEAPAEAEGALRLMTIHKAKGLEFDVTVLADASRMPPTRRAEVYISPIVGIAARPDRLEGEPLSYRLANAVDRAQSEAESRRLLYVAATRARDKLIINGHITQGRGRWAAAGWLRDILAALDLDADGLAELGQDETTITTAGGNAIGLTVASQEMDLARAPEAVQEWPTSQAEDLFEPIDAAQVESTDSELDEELEPDWRATGSDMFIPGAALGRLVHTALQRNCLPGDPSFGGLMRAEALRAGLVLPAQREAAVAQVQVLLARLKSAPIWDDLQRADPCLHEVPFTTPAGKTWARSGRIDLLYRLDDRWVVLDFKTEHLRDEKEMRQAAAKHFEKQIGPYVQAVERLLHERPLGRLCFLDMDGDVRLVDLAA